MLAWTWPNYRKIMKNIETLKIGWILLHSFLPYPLHLKLLSTALREALDFCMQLLTTWTDRLESGIYTPKWVSLLVCFESWAYMSLYEPIWASFTTGSKKCSLGKDEEFHSNLKTLSRTRAQFGSQTLCILRKEKGNSNTIPFYFPLFNYSFGFFSFRYSHHLPRSFGQ